MSEEKQGQDRKVSKEEADRERKRWELLRHEQHQRDLRDEIERRRKAREKKG